MVCGPNRKYLWLLARERHPAPSVIERLVTKAKELGFDTDKLVFLEQK